VPTRTQDQVAEGVPGDLDVLERPQDVDGAVRQNNPRPRCVLNCVLGLAWNVNIAAISLASTSIDAIQLAENASKTDLHTSQNDATCDALATPYTYVSIINHFLLIKKETPVTTWSKCCARTHVEPP
jgi:hypothetical protein